MSEIVFPKHTIWSKVCAPIAILGAHIQYVWTLHAVVFQGYFTEGPNV